MSARDFIWILILSLSAREPSFAQMLTVPSLGGALSGGAVAAAGTHAIAAPALSPTFSIGAPVLAASLPASPAPLAAAPAAAASVRIFDAPAGPRHTITGDVRLINNFPSVALNNSRTVAVFLPPGYETSSERYPVLYMQDGQNIFDAATAYAGNEWGVDEICQRMMLSGELPPFIVVAVYNTDNRISEYTTVPDAQYGGGNGANYEKFLINELKPFIDLNLRTLPDAANTGVMGSSLGGLISLDVGLKRSDVFSRIAGPSASLWWDGGELTRRLAAAPLPGGALPRIWVDMGTREGDHPADRVEELLTLGAVLKNRGWREGGNLAVRVIDGGFHGELSWRERTAEILKFLFPVGPRP